MSRTSTRSEGSMRHLWRTLSCGELVHPITARQCGFPSASIAFFRRRRAPSEFWSGNGHSAERSGQRIEIDRTKASSEQGTKNCNRGAFCYVPSLPFITILFPVSSTGRAGRFYSGVIHCQTAALLSINSLHHDDDQPVGTKLCKTPNNALCC